MAEEEDAPVVIDAAGLRFAEVVDERAEAKRAAAGEAVGERLGENRLDRVGVLAGEGREVALDFDDPPQDLERVAERVEVVVRVLGHTAQLLELRQHRRYRVQLVENLDPPGRVGPGEHRLELRKLALARGLSGAGRFRPGGLRGRLGQLHCEGGGESRRAQDAERVVGETRRRNGSQRAGVEIVATAVRIDQSIAGRPLRRRGQRDGHRVHGEIAPVEIGGDAVTAQAGDIDPEARLGRGNAPGSEALGQGEGMAPDLPGDGLCGLVLARSDTQVEVGDLPIEHRLPHGTTDDPALRAAKRRRRRRDRLRSAQAAGEGVGHLYSRGTRLEIPQVTS